MNKKAVIDAIASQRDRLRCAPADRNVDSEFAPIGSTIKTVAQFSASVSLGALLDKNQA